MVLIRRIGKFLMAIVLSALLILSKGGVVLAESKAPIDRKQQNEFLEEKRISQSLILEERRENSVVEGMKTSKDLENSRKAESEEENEIKRKERAERDIFSEVLESARKLHRRRQESKKLADEKAAKEAAKAKEEAKKAEPPVVEDVVSDSEEVEGSQTLAETASLSKEDGQASPPVEKNESSKDLLDKSILYKDPMNMSPSDIEMLERIVMAEAGGEPYLGQVAVANVVLNRLKSKSYPSTLEGVIFQKFQFSPVKNGVIRGQAPNESVKKAVAEALSGRMVVAEDTLYFVNPVLATDQTIPRTKTIVKVIGNHTFYK